MQQQLLVTRAATTRCTCVT